jgi:hypothetical protein
MPGKMARSDPRPSVRVTRGAGSGQHLASVLQEGRENANIDAGLGFIWRISANGHGHISILSNPEVNRDVDSIGELGAAPIIAVCARSWEEAGGVMAASRKFAPLSRSVSRRRRQ